MRYFFISLFIIINFIKLTAQENQKFFAGVNIGGHFANKNTSMKYSGFSPQTLGVEWYFNNPLNQQKLNEFFDGLTYNIDQTDLVDLPNRMRYLPSIEIGGIAGIFLNDGVSLFIEANVAQLRTQNVFVVEVTPSANTSNIDADRFRQIPVFGKEERLNMNLGFKFEVFENNGLKGYVPLFGNFNTVKLKENYFVLEKNNQIEQIPILHNSQNILQSGGNVISNNNVQPPGGSGFGLGSGFGISYPLMDHISVEINYNLMYSKVTVDRFLDPPFAFSGLHHNALFRVIWGM